MSPFVRCSRNRLPRSLECPTYCASLLRSSTTYVPGQLQISLILSGPRRLVLVLFLILTNANHLLYCAPYLRGKKYLPSNHSVCMKIPAKRKSYASFVWPVSANIPAKTITMLGGFFASILMIVFIVLDSPFLVARFVYKLCYMKGFAISLWKTKLIPLRRT